MKKLSDALANEYSRKLNSCEELPSAGSRKEVWWECYKCGNSWMASPLRRSQGYKNCIKCKSFAIARPSIIDECLMPEAIYRISPYSKDCLEWKCPQCHLLYYASPHSRMHGTGCPYCSGAKVSYLNCLSNRRPDLVLEWSKNNIIDPNEVSYGSSKKVLWECSKCGHEWKSRVDHRAISNNGCPNCCPTKYFVEKYNKWFKSKTEIFYYHTLLSDKIDFIYDHPYDPISFGKHRYDFYLIKSNTYVEVTGFNQKDWRNGKWFKYLRKIVKKKHFVEKELRALFLFNSIKLNNEQKAFVESLITEKN